MLLYIVIVINMYKYLQTVYNVFINNLRKQNMETIIDMMLKTIGIGGGIIISLFIFLIIAGIIGTIFKI